MKQIFLVFLAVFLWSSNIDFACAQANSDQSNPITQLPWQLGPTVGVLGEQATIKIPDGYGFLQPEGTRKLEQLMHNPPSNSNVYTVASPDLSWISFFSFDPVGYVKDDEKIDADAIIKTVREGTQIANEERKRNGWSALDVIGWKFEPRYNKYDNHLEWAILAQDESSRAVVVNYNTRILGRKGVMDVVVVASPEKLDTAVASFKNILSGFEYVHSEKYAEYKVGDHVAEYGLAALITGGVAAVAAKKGFFTVVAASLAAMWKVVLAAIFAALAWVKSLFKKKQTDAN